MKPTRKTEPLIRIRMATLIALVLFMSLWFAASGKFITTLNMEANPNIDNPNKANIKVQLETTELTTESDTGALKEAAETGKVSAEDVRRSYTTHPLDKQEVLIYYVTGERSEVVCSITTDEKGEGNCSRILETSKCGLIIANFSATEKYARSSALPRNHCSTAIPAFADIVGPEWLVLFLFLGILAAGLYASGRKPGAAFDVTTPKLKGAISAKPKSKIRTSLGGMYGAVVPAVSAALIRRRNKKQLSLNLEKAKKVIKKHGTPEMITKLRRSKNVSTDNMVKLVSNMMVGGGLYGSIKKKLSEKQKEHKKLLAQHRMATGEKATKLQATLSELDKTIKTYKKDLMAVSPSALMPGENFTDVNPESYEDIGKSVKASFVGLIFGEKGMGRGRLSENIDARTLEHADEMSIGNKGEFLRDYPTLRSGLVDVFSAKAELDRVKLAIYGKMLTKIKEKKMDRTKEYKDIFKKKKPMEEAGNDLLALMKKLDDKEYENMLKMLKDIEAADLTIARTEKKFLDSLRKIRELNEEIVKGMKAKMIGTHMEELKRKLEEATEDAGMAYLILKKRAKGYREVIEKDIEKNKLPLKLRKENASELGEILVNDAFEGKEQNKTKVVNVLIDTYLGQRYLPGGMIVAEKNLVERGNDVIYVNRKEEEKIRTLDMLEDLRSHLLNRSRKKTEVTTPENAPFGNMPLIRKLDKIIKEIKTKKESK